MMKKNISINLFLWSVILFCFNLRINYSGDYKIAIFWTSTIIMLGIILYQIFYLQNNQFVLFEIIIFFFLLHILYQISYFGLAESDSYRDYDFLKSILNNYHIIYESTSTAVSGWPMIHLLTSFIALIIKIDPLIIAKILPSFIESIIAISIYLLIHYIYKNEKAALLSCLIVGTIPKFVSFESLFVRESYALYFLILFFYVLYTAKQRDDHRLLILAIILIPIIVLSHHFTSFMFLVLLFIFIISSKIIPYLLKKNENYNNLKINITAFFIIILVTTLVYWSYFTPNIIRDFFQIYYDAVGIKEFVSYGQKIGIDQTIATLRGNIQYYGFFFFHGILSLIILIAIFFKKQKHIIENVTFSIFFFFCLFLGSLSLFVMGSLIYPDRFLPIGWLIGVIPLTGLLFNLKKKHLKKIVLVIVVCFLIFNIFSINPNYYTGTGVIDGRASEKEYAIAETINVSKPYYGYIGVADAIYDIQRVEFKHGGMINPLSSSDFFNDSNFAIIYKDLYLQLLKTEQIKSLTSYQKIVTLLSFEDSKDINKICDLGDVFIIIWKK